MNSRLLSIVKYRLDNRIPDNVKMLTDDEQMTDTAKLLINQGADVNVCDEDGNTVLMLACRYHYVDIVDCLIAADANVNATNRWGKTALDYVQLDYDHDHYVGEELIWAGVGLIHLRRYFGLTYALRVENTRAFCSLFDAMVAFKSLDLPVLLILEISLQLCDREWILFYYAQCWSAARRIKQI